MKSFTQLVERLTYDPYLRYICGFEPFGNVPSVSTFSRFYARLARAGVLELLFNSLVEKAEKMGLIDASTVAIDSTKLEAYQKPVPKKNINQDGRSADWGIKSDTNGNKENLGLEIGLKLGKYDKVTAHAYLCAITMYAAVIAVNQQCQNEEKLAV